MAPVLALELLKSCVLVLASAVLALAGVLCIVRSFGTLAAARARRRDSHLTRLIYDATQSDVGIANELRTLGWWDRKLVRSILLQLALDVPGCETIGALYIELGFAAKDLARLRSRRASARASAAANLGLVHSSEAVPALTLSLNDRDLGVRQAAVWALGEAATPATLRSLVRVLGERSLLVARRAQEVLAVRGAEIADDIVHYTESTSSRTGRLAAIELIGLLRLGNGAELLLGLSTHPDPEVRVKSVKAAAAMGGPRFLAAFHSRLEDSSWPVRCQAAKGLSRFGSSESIPRLSKALRDQRWWVRFRAAGALATLGTVGKQALAEALTDQNGQVRDMARYLLERGELVPAHP